MCLLELRDDEESVAETDSSMIAMKLGTTSIDTRPKRPGERETERYWVNIARRGSKSRDDFYNIENHSESFAPSLSLCLFLSLRYQAVDKTASLIYVYPTAVS